MFQVKSKKLKVKNLIVLSFAFLACFAGNLFAQKETPPVGGQPKPFVFPQQEVYTLPNGLKVTLVQYGSVPKVAFQATIYAGTKDDAKGKKAVSEMVGLMLKEGTKTRTAEQIARETAEMGGSINVGTGTDSTTVTGEVLSEFDAKFVELMADVMLNPNFQADSLEQLRALEHGISIGAAQVTSQMASVDTQEDLEHVRKLLKR